MIINPPLSLSLLFSSAPSFFSKTTTGTPDTW